MNRKQPPLTAGDERALTELSVIVPNLHWRYSGVTTANRAVAPKLCQHVRTAWLGPDAPDRMPGLTVAELFQLRLGAQRKIPRIWHARRNNEMIVGLLLKRAGWPFKLVFTSEAQRRHSWITRALIARMDAVLTTNEGSASYLQRPTIMVAHGVDSDVYRPPSSRAAAFAATGLPGKYAIGCFGRVRAQKGTDVFVEAMCALLPRYPDFTAVVIGAVTIEQRTFMRALEERVAAAGLVDRVRFLGELPIEDVPRWYQCISIYAFTSRNEGFGLTILEAMAAGTALVAARAGGAAHVISDGETGVLVPPGDVAALVAALEPLMRDPEYAAEMGRKARARAVAEFSLDAAAANVAAVYRTLLGEA